MDVNGNYLGFMDVGGVRYFDVREIQNIYEPITSFEEWSLPSDCTRRVDGASLKEGRVEEA